MRTIVLRACGLSREQVLAIQKNASSNTTADQNCRQGEMESSGARFGEANSDGDGRRRLSWRTEKSLGFRAAKLRDWLLDAARQVHSCPAVKAVFVVFFPIPFTRYHVCPSFSLSLLSSLPPINGRNSDLGPFNRLFCPLPATARALQVCREKRSALSSLVGSASIFSFGILEAKVN